LSINTSKTYTRVNCDILQTEYDVGFPVEFSEDLKVFKKEIATGVDTELFFNTDFILSNLGFDFSDPLSTKTALLTILAPLDSDYDLLFISTKVYILAFKFASTNYFDQATFQKKLFELERQVQQLNTLYQTCLSIDIKSLENDFTTTLVLTIPELEAYKYFRVNGTEDGIELAEYVLDFDPLQYVIPTNPDWIILGDTSDSTKLKKTTVLDLINLLSNSIDFNGIPADTPELADNCVFGDVSDSDGTKKATFSTLNTILDHNNLLNYVSDEHTDHSAIDVQGKSNSLISSTNSDLTSTVEFYLDESNGLGKSPPEDNDKLIIFDSSDSNNPKTTLVSEFKTAIIETASAKNFIINPCGCVARRLINTFNTGVQDSGIQKGETERFAGRVFSASANIGGGSLRQGTNAITSVPQRSHRFFNVTLTGIGSFIELFYRMPSEDASQFYNQTASFAISTAHNKGSDIPYEIIINKADAENNFTTVTNIDTSSSILVPDAGSKNTIKFENIDMGDCRNGIEIVVRANCDTIAGTTFEFSEAQFNLGSIVNQFSYQKTYGDMRQECSRYFYKTYDDGVDQGTVSTLPGSINVYSATTTWLQYGTNRINMRSAPTISLYSPITGSSGKIADDNLGIDKNGVVADIGMNAFQVKAGLGGIIAGNRYVYHWVADAELY